MKKGIQLNPVLDRITLKQVNRILSVIFIISLAPLLILAFFDHPAIDDFVFGAQIHHTIQAGGSIFDTVRVAVEQTAQVYQEWQGSFAAVFLFSFQPAVWGESFYWITPYIMLGIYVISTFFFGKVLCVDLLKASKAQWCLLSVLIMGISIQTMPSPVQGIYWYNGAVYYTFFYSLGLLLWGWILQEHLKHPSFLAKGYHPCLLRFDWRRKLYNSFVKCIVVIYMACGSYLSQITWALVYFCCACSVSRGFCR